MKTYITLVLVFVLAGACRQPPPDPCILWEVEATYIGGGHDTFVGITRQNYFRVRPHLDRGCIVLPDTHSLYRTHACNVQNYRVLNKTDCNE